MPVKAGFSAPPFYARDAEIATLQLVLSSGIRVAFYSGAIPIIGLDPGLTQNLFQQPSTDRRAFVGVGNAYLQRTPYHELVAPT